MQRPSFLAQGSALDALCQHFNVRPTAHPGGDLGSTFDMYVLRDAHMPTHVLAATQPGQNPSVPPLMLPIDLNLFEHGFPIELNIPPAIPGTTAPVPRLVLLGGSRVLMVNLPIVPLTIPHANSLPILLLYGMRLETDTNILSFNLLPVNVVEEFPNAAAMSTILARHPDETFEKTYRHNQGLWKNILSMGLNHTPVLELVQMVWNITAEARRIRYRTTH
ncbi:hypothetical protein M413DRAFT_441547 [Hebeloma cylindrosporum]|uniref:Uncharacterized protein n=1 Tax=Hebeloma cylindrosporum TaxID=76867 RepID=A0A0C2Y9D2_HEBCY|nr:hypothetical protein M413DRAFT_441547 [Hebeloma cylindrosporum h7]